MLNIEGSIIVTAQAQARPGREAEAEQLLSGLVAPTRGEPGCLRYELLCGDNAGSFLFIEAWQSRDHLDRHLRQEHMRSFISRAGELLAGPLQVSIWKSITGPS